MVATHNRDAIERRFWSKVERTETCWLWTTYLDKQGYGRFFPTRKKNVRAHRFAYEMLVGPVPEGLQLDHLCRVRHCVNPDHLEPVTSRENTMRGTNQVVAKARQTHCINGHPFDANNTYKHSDGRRQCRACRNRSRDERRRKVSQ